MGVRGDTQIQKLTHRPTRNNGSGAGFHKDHREKIELLQKSDEERRRTLSHIGTEDSVEDEYNREHEEIATKNKMERHVPTSHEHYWTVCGRGDGQGDME